jgi:hypothetical protein
MEQLNIHDEPQQKDTQEKGREGFPPQEIMEIIAQGSANFILTLKMLFLDEETTQKPLKDIDTLDLDLAKIPIKALYKL